VVIGESHSGGLWQLVVV